ncbi:Hypothetical_protein [Hexamita inflata]|uniref:Hypothetical_protein n=1 Tax=Hexamita inflata TaxID=28002 RepID=A0AA86NC23_9EUKA|nr:Hypothetical protein HINF_LOCUS4160 [Hexamita inflata]
MIVLATSVSLLSNAINIESQPIFKSKNLNDINCTENQIIYAEIIDKEMTFSCKNDDYEGVAIGLGCYLAVLIILFSVWIWFWFIKPTQSCCCKPRTLNNVNQ